MQERLNYFQNQGFEIETIVSQNPELKPDCHYWINYHDVRFLKKFIDSPQLTVFISVKPQNIYSGLTKIAVASFWMKEQMQKHWPDAKIDVLPPLIEAHPQVKDLKHIIFINPVKEKGFEFAKELAASLKDKSFLFVQNWPHYQTMKIGQYDNIEVVSRQEDLKNVFETANALIIPSIIEEGFCRVAMEAMSAGVFVIGSTLGALPETISEGGLTLPLQMGLWVEALKNPPKKLLHFERFKRFTEETEKLYSQFIKAS